MKRFFCKILVLIFCFFQAPFCCAVEVPPSPSMLELRERQTRFFDTADTFMVMKAVINTLQDNGFVIQKAEFDLGYIRAQKDIKLKRTMKGRVALYSTSFALNATCLALSFGANPAAIIGMFQDSMRIKNEIAPHTVIFDSNVVVQKVGKRTKVRFVVVEKVLENADGYTTVKSSPRDVFRNFPPEIYQEFFAQLDKNIFLDKNL